jgi:hypothetical protein
MNIENFVNKVTNDKSINHKKYRIDKKEPIATDIIEREEKRLQIKLPDTYKEILKKWGYWNFLATEFIPLQRMRKLDQNYGPLEGLIPFARIPGGEIIAFKKTSEDKIDIIQYHPRTLGHALVSETFDKWLEMDYEFFKVIGDREKSNEHPYRKIHLEILETAKHWRSSYPPKFVHLLRPYLNTYISNFPAIALIIYLIGFVIFTSHLISYGISEYNLLNFNFLKAGLVFSILILPSIVISITSVSRGIDDYMPRFGLSILVAINSIFYVTIINSIIGIVYLLLFSNPNESIWYILTISVAGTIFFAVLTLVISDVRKLPFIIILFIVILAIAYQYFLLQNFNVNYTYLSVYIVGLNSFLTPDIIRLIEEKFNGLVALLSPSIILIIALFIFGISFYKIIPSNIGGGKPIHKKVIIDKSKLDAKSLDFNYSSLIDTSKQTYEIVYESSEMYYIKISFNKIIGINKEFIIGEINIPFEFPKREF